MKKKLSLLLCLMALILNVFGQKLSFIDSLGIYNAPRFLDSLCVPFVGHWELAPQAIIKQDELNSSNDSIQMQIPDYWYYYPKDKAEYQYYQWHLLSKKFAGSFDSYRYDLNQFWVQSNTSKIDLTRYANMYKNIPRLILTYPSDKKGNYQLNFTPSNVEHFGCLEISYLGGSIKRTQRVTFPNVRRLDVDTAEAPIDKWLLQLPQLRLLNLYVKDFGVLKHYSSKSSIKCIVINILKPDSEKSVPKAILKAKNLEVVWVQVDSITPTIVKVMNSFDRRIKTTLYIGNLLRPKDIQLLKQIKHLDCLDVSIDDGDIDANQIDNLIEITKQVSHPDIHLYSEDDNPLDEHTLSLWSKLSPIIYEKTGKFLHK